MGNKEKESPIRALFSLDAILKIIFPLLSAIYWIASLSIRVANLEEFHNKNAPNFITKQDERIMEMRVNQLEKEHEKMLNEHEQLKLITRQVK